MNDLLLNKIKSKKAKVAIIGLGYVGLTIMEAVGTAGFTIIGYDQNKEKIKMLSEGTNYLKGVDLPHLSEMIRTNKLNVSTKETDLADADIFIITVGTSLDAHREPDLTHLHDAIETIEKIIKPGSLVILQSTSFPGTTETELLPILQKGGRNVGSDFFLSFIPEISDFGNLDFDFYSLPKLIGGITSNCAEISKTFYEMLVKTVVVVSSPKIAEAAKLLQNAYRLINISFVNEMKIMFDHMGIDIWEVIDAAKTKPFGFTPFYPGPGIGGDCIPIGPHYLVWKARETEGPTSLLEAAEKVNLQMTKYVIDKIIDSLNAQKKPLKGSNILILGVAFKKEVNDIRESCSIKIIDELLKKEALITYNDPYIPSFKQTLNNRPLELNSTDLNKETLESSDCVVILTDHNIYNWEEIGSYAHKIVDTRNAMSAYHQFKNKILKA